MNRTQFMSLFDAYVKDSRASLGTEMRAAILALPLKARGEAWFHLRTMAADVARDMNCPHSNVSSGSTMRTCKDCYAVSRVVEGDDRYDTSLSFCGPQWTAFTHG